MAAGTSYCIDFEDVKSAAQRIDGSAHRTPVLTSSSLDEMMGRHLFFKIEALQRTGSFKFRGAFNAIQNAVAHLPLNQSSLKVVTHSSGNHAQAVALASQLASSDRCKVSATIVMPENAPEVKKAAVSHYGASIVMVANSNEAREAEANRITKDTCALFVHPSENPYVIAGQGTVCLEFVEQVNEMKGSLDAVIIPVGGGGLASGNCITLRALLGNDVKIILAEPAELDDAKRSFESGKLLTHRADNWLNSVADGLKTTLGPNTWPIVRDHADDIFTVTEEEIMRATKIVWEHLKVCIEPSAGVGVAVCMMSREFREKYTPEAGIENVGIVLGGGNVDILRVTAQMQLLGM